MSNAKVSIPANVKKTIQNLKEIAGSHSDEDIYAMLRECNMDPNETAQRLLLQDPFHEVKRKRDKRKEGQAIKDSGDSRSRGGSQIRAVRGGRGYPGRYIANDAGGSRGSILPSENGGPNHVVNKNQQPSQAVASQTANVQQPKVPTAPTSPKQAIPDISANLNNESITKESRPATETGNSVSNQLKLTSEAKPSQPDQTSTSTSVARHSEPVTEQRVITLPSSEASASVSGVYSAVADPVVVPKLLSHTSGAVGTGKPVVGPGAAQQVGEEQAPLKGTTDSKPASPKFSASVTNQSVAAGVAVSDVAKVQASTFVSSGTPINRASATANHYQRSQQPVGSHRVSVTKEWKPKPTNSVSMPVPGIIGTSTVSNGTVETSRSPSPIAKSDNVEAAIQTTQKKIESLNVHDEHIIIPDHLRVSEAERTALSFGSFDPGFAANLDNKQVDNKSLTPPEDIKVEEQACEDDGASASEVLDIVPSGSQVSADEDYPPQRPESENSVPNNVSSADAALPNTVAVVSHMDAPKTEILSQPGPQFSVAAAAPNYTGVSWLPMIGGQYPSYEHNEPHIQDPNRVPFVQPSYDPSTSYYNSAVIRPGSDGEPRFSSVIGSGAHTKFTGNIAVPIGMNMPTSQESANSLVNAGSTLASAAAAGVVQTTPPLPQQGLPMFRQAAPPFTANYIPFHPFGTPLYVHSTPGVHNFVGNGTAFTQLPAANSYPSALAAASGSYPHASMKFPAPQYKPGSVTGNSPHVAAAAAAPGGGYNPSGFTATPSVSTGTSPAVEDIGGVPQQGEGSGVWMSGLHREISGISTSSFYNMTPQGHVPYAHSQGGHAGFPGLYHPTQAAHAQSGHALLQQNQALGGPVGVVAPQTGLYQQNPQRPPLNWNNTY